MTKLKDMIDLKTVRGSIGRLTQELVDQRKAIHRSSNLLRSIPDEARRACDHGAIDES
jgi:hypothetical protein